jgi:hypothetical protein
MFLRSNRRRKDGKEHRYYTVVESRRLQSGKVAQRQVLYLGEINDSQQATWRKTLEVFDEQQHRFTPLSLFPEDQPVPADAIDSVQVKLSEMKLERARAYGNCWLGCEMWRQLRLDRFWSGKLPPGREGVAWPQVLELLVVNRLIDPGSEFRLHRQWFDQSAMDVLLGQDFAVAEKDRLYRCLDRVLEHKQELFVHLQQRWKDLFDAEFDLIRNEKRACIWRRSQVPPEGPPFRSGSTSVDIYTDTRADSNCTDPHGCGSPPCLRYEVWTVGVVDTRAFLGHSARQLFLPSPSEQRANQGQPSNVLTRSSSVLAAYGFCRNPASPLSAKRWIPSTSS